MTIRYIPAALALLLAACTPSFNVQVAVPRPSEAAFAVTLEADATSGVAPLAVSFTAATPESATYAWFVNDRRVGGQRSTLTHTFRTAGFYEVTVAATNAAGVADTDSVSVEVSEASGEDGETATVDGV